MDKKIDPIKSTQKTTSGTGEISSKSSKGASTGTLAQLPKDYNSNMQILKTDLTETSSLIKRYSDVLIFYKSSLNVYPKFIQKKLNSLNIEDLSYDKMKIDSENTDKYLQIYDCKTAAEMAPKLLFELSCYETLMKKLENLAFLITARVSPDFNNDEIYKDKDTESKVHQVVNLFELMLSKLGKYDDNKQSMKGSQGDILYTSKTTGEKKKFTSEIETLLNFSNIDDFFLFNSHDKVINHLQNLFKNSYTHLTKEFENLANKLATEEDKFQKDNTSYHENLLNIEKYFSQAFVKKDHKIEELNKSISDLDLYVKNLHNLEKLDLKNESEKIQFLFKIVDDCILIIKFILFN